MSEFPIGSIVRLHGLVAKPEMNGRRGTVRSFVEETGRYGVEIIPSPGEASDTTVYKLRTQNLTVESSAVGAIVVLCHNDGSPQDGITAATAAIAQGNLSPGDMSSVRVARATALCAFARLVAAHPATESDASCLFGSSKVDLCEMAVADCDEVLRLTSADAAALRIKAFAAHIGLQHCARQFIVAAMVANPTDEMRQLLAEYPEARATTTEFECPLCCRMFFEPVTTACGHTFCRACLGQAMDHTQRCPCCRAPLHMSAQRHPVTVVLVSFLERVHPEEYAARRAEVRDMGTDGAPLPLFVLSTMFPPHRTSLNVFEPRYRLMIRRCLEGSRCFGIVEHTGDGFSMVGTVVRITNCAVQPDGQLHIDIVGESRIRIVEHWDQDGYHVARVVPIRDEGPATPEDVAWVHEHMNTFRAQHPSSAPDIAGPESESLFLAGLNVRRLGSRSLEVLGGTDLGARVLILKSLNGGRGWWPFK